MGSIFVYFEIPWGLNPYNQVISLNFHGFNHCVFYAAVPLVLVRRAKGCINDQGPR